MVSMVALEIGRDGGGSDGREGCAMSTSCESKHPMLPPWESTGTLTVEALLICDIIHKQDPHSTSVVHRRDCSETFLPSCVPYLQLDSLAVEVDRPDLEVDADGRDERRRERVFAEAQQAA